MNNKNYLYPLIALSLLVGIASAQPTLPAGTLYYIPINVVNNQPSAVSANTPIMITFNAIGYQQYETCNLNNAEFFFANGTVATSWMEGSLINPATSNAACTSASSPNALVNSANVSYWVKIPSGSFLPANTGTAATNTIYLGWAGNTLGTANTLLSSTLAGEARNCHAPRPPTQAATPSTPMPNTTTERAYSPITTPHPLPRADGRSQAFQDRPRTPRPGATSHRRTHSMQTPYHPITCTLQYRT